MAQAVEDAANADSNTVQIICDAEMDQRHWRAYILCSTVGDQVVGLGEEHLETAHASFNLTYCLSMHLEATLHSLNCRIIPNFTVSHCVLSSATTPDLNARLQHQFQVALAVGKGLLGPFDVPKMPASTCRSTANLNRTLIGLRGIT